MAAMTSCHDFSESLRVIKRDKKLAEAVKKRGPVERKLNPNEKRLRLCAGARITM